MKTTRFFLASFVLLLLLGNKLSAGNNLSGVITDFRTGAPLQGALVSAIGGAEGLTFEAVSDEKGNYELELPDGFFEIVVEFTGYLTATGFSILVTGETDLSDFNFQLRPANPNNSKLAGTIINKVTQEPVGSASLFLFSDFGITTLISESDGSFEIVNLQAVEYRLMVFKSGYDPFVNPESYSFDFDTQITEVVIELETSGNNNLGSFGGQVLANTPIGDEGIAGANVSMLGYHIDTGDSVYYETTTDVNGSFFIPDVQPAIYNILVSADEYKSFKLPDYPILGDEAYDFLLDPFENRFSSLSGRVFFENGESLSSAKIELINLDGATFERLTSFDGFYNFIVPPGDYKIKMSYAFFDGVTTIESYYENASSLDEATVISVDQGASVSGIDFLLELPDNLPTITVRGSVSDLNGIPIPDASVTGVKFTSEFFVEPIDYQTNTDENGNYELIIPNFKSFISLSLSATKQGYKPQFYGGESSFLTGEFLSGSGDTIMIGDMLIISETEIEGIDFELEEILLQDFGAISGIIIGADGLGVSSSMIIATNVDNGEEYSTFSDSLGGFFLGALPFGTYIVLFMAEGYVPEYFDQALEPENAELIFVDGDINIVATLDPLPEQSNPGAIVGTVVNGTNKSLPGVLVIISGMRGNPVSYSYTGSNGKYYLENLSEGEYMVSARKFGFNPINASVFYSPAAGNSMSISMSSKNAVTSVDRELNESLPSEFTLGNNYPNPFNPTTEISFALPVDSKVKLRVYNIIGQEIALLANANFKAGTHRVMWNGTNENGLKVPSGIYLYSLEAGNTKLVKKMMLTK